MEKEPDSGWFAIGVGVVIAALGMLVITAAGDAAFFGWVLCGVGAVFVQVGTVAVGVTMGLRRADYLRRL